MRRSASLAVGHSLVRTFQSFAGCLPACAWFKLVQGREAMPTGSGEMHLCLPLDGQSEEALASSTQVDRDWEKGCSGVTSCFSPEAGECMEGCSLSTLFPHRTSYKLLHSAFGEVTRD
jgi:hypothetical protein